MAWVIELSQTPVNKPKLPIFVVNHDVVWLDVPVHDAHAVTIVEGLKQFVQVEANVIVCQRLVKQFEVGVVDVLEN